ncbi:phosphoribosylamine--glycine ligase, partial [bacterium]|nr:phosphoribosylamine--glycine ligase [bacterium]
MNILVVGSGGREHALIWKLKKSPLCENIFCAPGNAGTARIAHNVAIAETEFAPLADFCGQKAIDLVVIGPEAPLAMGLADHLREKGISVFGPSQSAARLESSKEFSRELMQKYDVPSPEFQSFN